MVKSEQALGTEGFIRRHWSGEYSFLRSFWLHTILLSWFIPIVAMTLLSSNTWHIPARDASIAFVAIFVVFYPSLLWGMRGTARASQLYQEKGGRKTWATAATMVSTLLLVDSLYFILNTRAIVIEHFHMAFTGKYGPPVSISVVNSGTLLLLTGELRQGSAEAFALVLDRSPSVTAIALDSKGGLLQEASLMARSVSRRGLDTYAKTECSSACTFVFLAGRHRCVAEGARIGFHAASYVRDLSRKTFQSIADYQRTLYVRAGLPGPFIDTIMETDSSRVWYPSRQELLEARVTTPDCQGVFGATAYEGSFPPVG
jgi:hypothetical protein